MTFRHQQFSSRFWLTARVVTNSATIKANQEIRKTTSIRAEKISSEIKKKEMEPANGFEPLTY